MEVLSNIPHQVSIQVVIHSYSSRMLVFSGAFWYALPELTQFTQLYSYMHTQINRGRCPLNSPLSSTDTLNYAERNLLALL